MVNIEQLFQYPEPDLDKFLSSVGDRTDYGTFNRKRYMTAYYLGSNFQDPSTTNINFKDALLYSNTYEEYIKFINDPASKTMLEVRMGQKLLKINKNLKNVEWFLQELRSSKTIENVEVSSSDEYVQQLLYILKSNTSVKSLLLFNQTNHENVTYIVDFFRTNTRIVSFELFSPSFNVDDVNKILVAISANDVLTKLYLTFDMFDVNGILIISNWLRKTKTLQFLRIFETKHTARRSDINHIFDALAINKSLKSLRLRNMGITNITSLCSALMINDTLEELDIGSNLIRNVDCISNVLEHNRSLKIFSIFNNYIGSEGVEIITNALKRNTTLTELNISTNEMGTTGINMIINFLDINTTITDMDIDDKTIDEKLERNKVRKEERRKEGIMIYLSLTSRGINRDIIDEFIRFHV